MRRELVILMMALAVWTIQPAAAHSGERIALDTEEQARAGIVVRPVVEQSFGDRIRVVGLVVRSPGSTVTVKTVVGGRVEKLLATPGTAVRAGQPLLTLHSHELHRLQSDLLQSVELAKLAQLRLRAGEQLLQIEGISKMELEQRRQKALAARLAADATRAELRDLGYSPGEIEGILTRAVPDPHLTILAPASGVVLQLDVEEHEWVQGYAPLVMIGDPRRVELELQIPPDQASRVAAGDTVTFLPVGRPDLGGKAVVVTSVPQVDPTTRTIVIRARITGSSRGMVPGIFVEGALMHGQSRTAPSIPEAAVSRLQDRDVVFVRTGPEEFEVRPVKLGVFDHNRYEVLSGVTAGEEVVVNGAFFLKSKLLKSAEGEG